MEQAERTLELGEPEHNRPERNQMDASMETLSMLASSGESLTDVAHDARNMVTALGLYCDLIEEPGVLAAPFHHYGSELRLVASASRRLVEKLALLRFPEAPDPSLAPGPIGPSAELSFHGLGLGNRPNAFGTGPQRVPRWDTMPAAPIESLAAELTGNRNLLAALAGAAISLSVELDGGDRPVRLTGEDLTRVLVNLVKNASEAMPKGGRISIGLREIPPAADGARWLSVAVEDNGPGIPPAAHENIFESGYTTRSRVVPLSPGWPASHRGLGLSISRSIVETAGGRIRSAETARPGARFEIDLPVRDK